MAKRFVIWQNQPIQTSVVTSVIMLLFITGTTAKKLFTNNYFDSVLGSNEGFTSIATDDEYIYIGSNKGSIWRINPQSKCPAQQATLLILPSIENQIIQQMEIITQSLNNSNKTTMTNTKQIAIISHNVKTKEAQVVIADLSWINNHQNRKCRCFFKYLLFFIFYFLFFIFIFWCFLVYIYNFIISSE